MKRPSGERTCTVCMAGGQDSHELSPSETIRTWEVGPGIQQCRRRGEWVVDERSLPSSDQETEMRHQLGLQQEPLNGCFRLRTLGPIPFPHPLSQRALGGAAKPQLFFKKKNRAASWNLPGCLGC